MYHTSDFTAHHATTPVTQPTIRCGECTPTNHNPHMCPLCGCIFVISSHVSPLPPFQLMRRIYNYHRRYHLAICITSLTLLEYIRKTLIEKPNFLPSVTQSVMEWLLMVLTMWSILSHLNEVGFNVAYNMIICISTNSKLFKI